MPPKYDVLVVGGYSVDLIFTGLARLPEPGAAMASTDFTMIPGEAFTSTTAMHRLGVRVAWAGDFGSDPFSTWVLQEARKEGLDERFFIRHPHPLKRTTVVFSYPEDRMFVTYYDPDPLVQSGYKALLTASTRVVFVPGLFYGDPFDLGQRWLRLRKIKLVMDGNAGTDNITLQIPAVRRAICAVDIFLPNAREARMLTSKTDLESALVSLGELCPLVVVKDGPNGSYARQDGRTVHVTSIPVVTKDTTGAGDCFNAGFLKAWLEGQPLETCLKWGNIVGALSTQGFGGTGYRTTVESVRERLSC